MQSHNSKCILGLLGITLLVFSQPLFAQDPSTWQPTFGPPGGTVHSFATLRENVVLAGTNRGVYVSLDNGSNWTQRSEGYIDEAVHALMVTDSGSLFAGTNEGVYRSTDTGLTWSLLDTGLESPSFTALTHGGDSLFAGGPGGVLWSIDNGETWELLNEGLFDIRITSLAYTQEGDILAGTGEGVFQLVQLTTEWRAASNGLNRSTDRIIHSIKRYDARRLLASTASGVFFSDADSIAWNQSIGEFDGEPTANVIDLAIDPSGIMYAATPQQVYRSYDEGINWESIPRGLPPIESSFQSLNTLHLDSNKDLLAGTAYYGVYKYIAPIEQWQSSTHGIATLSVSSMMLNLNGDILAGTNTGLFVSTDQGTTWDHTRVSVDLSGFELVHQDHQGRLFANGPSLLMSEDQGITWTPLRPDKADAFIVLEDNTFITIPEISNSVLRSTNEGETWTEVGAIPSQVAFFIAYALLEDNQGRVLAGTAEGVFRSSDRGATWESISLAGGTDSGLSLAKDGPGNTYVGGNKGLYRSDHNGDNFELILDVTSSVQNVLVQDERKILVITSQEGIFRSVDAGVIWTPLNDGLPEDAELLTAVFDGLTILDALNAYVSLEQAGIYQGVAVIQLSHEEVGHEQYINVSAYPNPAPGTVTINLTLERAQHVSIHVFDVLGRKVKTLLDASVQPGNNELKWDTMGLPAGAYFIQAQVHSQRIVHSIIKTR